MSTDTESGGFLEVQEGVELNGYQLLKFLGDGSSATVWLALDTHTDVGDEDRWVALKIMRSTDRLCPQALHEAALNDFISRKSSVIARGFESGTAHHFEHFFHETASGVHVCMVMQLLGPPLDSIIPHGGIPDIIYVKNIIISILYGLDELQSLRIAHTDLKPENILLREWCPSVKSIVEEHDGVKLMVGNTSTSPVNYSKISDFGLSYLLSPAGRLHMSGEPLSKRDWKLIDACCYEKGSVIQTREYRAPEVIVGSDFGTESDIWSLGCICFELLTGRFLFDPKTAKGATDEQTIDFEHLLRITSLFGEAKCSEIKTDGVFSRTFYPNGKLDSPLPDQPRMSYSGFQGALHSAISDLSESSQAAHFIESCLSWKPKDRPTPVDLLCHPWLEDAMNDIRGCRETMFSPQRKWSC
eukprot:TRINITY_DN360_c0_g2_i1.p1 TRINITY_DN360_c0_g2~~TRINITY_DN360_c0_g2_i1.p1  ORF type:complete len:414 (+),score=76.71 TRINITY_DN360_c0_g2_i1:69-1310(+)